MPSPRKPTTWRLQMQRLHDARLLRWRQLGQHRSAFHLLGQFVVAPAVDFAAEDDAAHRQPDLAADVARDRFVVAGQHLDGHAVLLQHANGLAGAVLRRIEKGDIAGEYQSVLVGHAVGRLLRRQFLVSDGNDPEAVVIEFARQRLQLVMVFWFQRYDFAVLFGPIADVVDLLDRSLADQDVRAAVLGDDNRHPATLEVERDFVDLGELRVRAKVLVHLDVFEHRHVEQVLEARLVVAVEVRVFEHALGLLAEHVDVLLQQHLVLRQRARLVGAQHVHRAQVLDRIQPLDDDLLAGHRQRALGEVDGHDHGQHFRRQPDRHRDGEQECLQPVALGQPVDQKHEWHHHEHEADHEPDEPADAPVEAGHDLLAGHARRDAAEVRARAR